MSKYTIRVNSEWCVAAPDKDKAATKVEEYLNKLLKQSDCFYEWERVDDIEMKDSPYTKGEYYTEINVYTMELKDDLSDYSSIARYLTRLARDCGDDMECFGFSLMEVY